MCLSFTLACGAEPGLDDFLVVDGIYTVAWIEYSYFGGNFYKGVYGVLGDFLDCNWRVDWEGTLYKFT